MNVCYHARITQPLISRIDQTSDCLEAGHLDVSPPHSVDGGCEDDEGKQDSKHHPDHCGRVLVRVTGGRCDQDRGGGCLSCCCPCCCCLLCSSLL